jgi:hypothetical protein
MVSRKITKKPGRREEPGCSPPFSRDWPACDYSLLRAKILARLDDEDIRDALPDLGTRPL